MGRLLISFGSVSVVAVVVFVVAEGLGVDAGLDAIAPSEEGVSRRVHDFLYRWTLISGAIALALGVALAVRFTVMFVRPVRSLAANASAFAAGARDVRCESDSGVRELDELARSFNTMADAVQAHEVSRGRLLSDIAHELRSPLTVVTGQLEEMRDGLVPADRETLAALHAECQRLAATARDLAQLASDDPTVTPIDVGVIDLGLVAWQAVAVRQRAFQDAGLTLECVRGHVMTCSDEQRVRQVLGNLLDNCYRYCSEGDLVRVSVARGDLVWLVVDDTGPGMSAEERQLATQHGFRGRVPAGVPGTGAGLALVRQWVEVLGGQVDLRPSPLSGLRVAVGLPLCDSAARRRGAAGALCPGAAASPSVQVPQGTAPARLRLGS